LRLLAGGIAKKSEAIDKCSWSAFWSGAQGKYLQQS